MCGTGWCGIINNKSCLSHFVSCTELQNTWNFLGYVNEVTWGGSLDKWLPEKPALWVQGTLGQPDHLGGEEDGNGMQSCRHSLHQACPHKETPIKTEQQGSVELSYLVNILRC